MRLDLRNGTVAVTLSHRNLLALLQKLNDPLSGRLLYTNNAYRDGEPVVDTLLVVRVEPDERHYADRPAPGRMHPATEAFISRVSGEDGSRN